MPLMLDQRSPCTRVLQRVQVRADWQSNNLIYGMVGVGGVPSSVKAHSVSSFPRHVI